VIRTRVAASLLALTAACRVAPPPQSVSSEHGAVRAETVIEAQMLADLVNELYPRVRELVPDTPDQDIEIWQQDDLRLWTHRREPLSTRGFTVRELHRIHLRDNRRYSRWFLVHELVHALHGPSWHTLPAACMEGLCDWVAARLTPQLTDTIRVVRLLEASRYCGGMPVRIGYTFPRGYRGMTVSSSNLQHLRITSDPAPEWSVERVLSIDPLDDAEMIHRPEASGSYGLGFLFVSRIIAARGIAGLHTLCVRAAAEHRDLVPFEWLADAAELHDRRDLTRAVAAGLDRRAVRALVDDVPDLLKTMTDRPARAVLPEVIVQILWPRFCEMSAAECLDRTHPQLRLADGTRIALDHMHRLRRDFTTLWEANQSRATQ